jgi:hypothetical protein
MTTEGTKGTKGTMTATSTGEDNFVANSGFSISLNHAKTHWRISADDWRGAPNNRNVSIYVPSDLPDDEDTTWPFSASDAPGDAYATYMSSDFFVPSYSGTLKVRYSAKQEKMSGSFNFQAKFGGKEFHLKDGLFEMTGLTGSATLAEQSFTANLSEAISEKFQADTMEVTFNPNTRILGFAADQIIWDSLPPRLHRVTLFIREGIKKGTHPIGKFGADIYAAYIVPGPGDPSNFASTEGKLELLSDPDETRLEATLEFTAESSGAPDVAVTNGVIQYQKPVK